MGKDSAKIRDAIHAFIKMGFSREEVYSSIAQVKTVDANDRTCEVEFLNGAAPITARCQSAIGLTGGIFPEPVIDSFVLVGWMSTEIAFIACYGEIENLYIDVNTHIQFNGGNNGGLVKVSDLVNKLNSIASAFNTHTHSGVQPGAGSTAGPSANISNTNVSDLENPDITH